MTRLLALACATLLGISSASAQSYPTKPILMVVPFAPGGLTDVMGRIVAEGMRKSLGQAVVVENVGGATGSIGSGRVARAAPDGYTIVFGLWNTHVSNGVVYKLDYDVVKDFTPVAAVGGAPLVYVIRKGLPANNLKEFVEWIKANPGKANTGTAGTGAPSTLLHTILRKERNLKYEIIGYRGAGLVPQDLLSGQLDMAILNTATSLPHVKSGAFKALAITSDNRLSVAPEIPTMAEAGFPEMAFSLWGGVWAPKDTPKEIVEKLTKAVQEGLADPANRERLIRQGVEIFPLERQTPAGLAALQEAEIKRWWPIIKDAGVKAQ